MFKNWSIDRLIIVSVTLAVLGEVTLNYITSYQHIYVLGLKYGEYGTDARLMPVAIDLMLLAFALINLYLSRKDRKSTWMRLGLALGVLGTVMANLAYGAFWGRTGAMLAGWPAVALFATVEGGMFLLRVAAEEAEKAAKAARDSARAVKAAATKRRQERELVPGKAQAPPWPDVNTEAMRGLNGIGLRNGGQ